MKCQKCGNSVKEGQKYCRNCGTRLEGQRQPGNNTKAFKNKTGLMGMIILIAVIIIAGGIGGIFFLGQDSDESYQQILMSANRYYEKQQYAKAEEFYLRSIEIEPMEKEPYVQLYKVYVDQEKYTESEQLLQKAQETLPAQTYQEVKKEVETYQESIVSRKEREETAAVQAQAMERYQQALIRLKDELIFPDGTLPKNTQYPIIYFALCDVDQDGVDELMIRYEPSGIITFQGLIYKYLPEKDDLINCFTGGTWIRPLENGYLEYSPMHDYSYSAILYPYNIYQWNQDSQEYERKYFVEGFEQRLATSTNPFPQEKDLDGNGHLIGFVEYEDPEEVKYLETQDFTWLDESQFQEWEQENYPDLNYQEIPVDWKELTDENILAVFGSLSQASSEVSEIPIKSGTFDLIAGDYAVNSQGGETKITFQIEDNAAATVCYEVPNEGYSVKYAATLTDLNLLDDFEYTFMIDTISQPEVQMDPSSDYIPLAIMEALDEKILDGNVKYYREGMEISNIPSIDLDLIELVNAVPGLESLNTLPCSVFIVIDWGFVFTDR